MTPLAIEKLPKPFRGLALRLFVRRKVFHYLEAVTRGIKIWVETGKSVDQAAFQRHLGFAHKRGIRQEEVAFASERLCKA